MFTQDGLITLNMLELPGFMYASKSFDICDMVSTSTKDNTANRQIFWLRRIIPCTLMLNLFAKFYVYMMLNL